MKEEEYEDGNYNSASSRSFRSSATTSTWSSLSSSVRNSFSVLSKPNQWLGEVLEGEEIHVNPNASSGSEYLRDSELPPDSEKEAVVPVKKSNEYEEDTATTVSESEGSKDYKKSMERLSLTLSQSTGASNSNSNLYPVLAQMESQRQAPKQEDVKIEEGLYDHDTFRLKLPKLLLGSSFSSNNSSLKNNSNASENTKGVRTSSSKSTKGVLSSSISSSLSSYSSYLSDSYRSFVSEAPSNVSELGMEEPPSAPQQEEEGPTQGMPSLRASSFSSSLTALTNASQFQPRQLPSILRTNSQYVQKATVATSTPQQTRRSTNDSPIYEHHFDNPIPPSQTDTNSVFTEREKRNRKQLSIKTKICVLLSALSVSVTVILACVLSAMIRRSNADPANASSSPLSKNPYRLSSVIPDVYGSASISFDGTRLIVSNKFYLKSETSHWELGYSLPYSVYPIEISGGGDHAVLIRPLDNNQVKLQVLYLNTTTFTVLPEEGMKNTFEQHSYTITTAISDNGTLLAVGLSSPTQEFNGYIMIYQYDLYLEKWMLHDTITEQTTSLSFSAPYLAFSSIDSTAATRSVKIYSIQNKEYIHTFKGGPDFSLFGQLISLSKDSSNSLRIGILSPHSSLVIYRSPSDVHTPWTQEFMTKNSTLSKFALSANGDHVLLGIDHYGTRYLPSQREEGAQNLVLENGMHDFALSENGNVAIVTSWNSKRTFIFEMEEDEIH